ncbi:uncharacterized protein LOC128216182 [Mya arenaria]|uniref:uncharacterized protein LOC128216182 n=1 Tax=Mya arenaria TaxID=6604 RepID=UPI0022E8D06F|nr:uncharacterized protein LOC128216182 [Mya arenaria]
MIAAWRLSSRLAVLLADAISKVDEILHEIGELLWNKNQNKADGTEVPSISSESSDDESSSKKNATITSIQKSSPQPITEIGQWNRAFQMYADVYSAKYPAQAPHLFRYMSIIQHLANTSKHWQLYDEKFRKLRAVSPSIPWGIIHTETYLFCSILNQPFRGPSNVNSKFLSNKIMFRKGYCWDYQQSGQCIKPKCTVAHHCSNCEGPHGASRCSKPFNMPKRYSFNTPNFQKSGHSSIKK